MNLGRRTWSVYAIAVSIAACSAAETRLRVDHRDGRTRVKLERSERAIVETVETVPIADCTFYRVDDDEGGSVGLGNEIWRVFAPAPGVTAPEIHYGRVPSGFAQVTPPKGSPPPLQPGRRYRADCQGKDSAVTEFRIPGVTTRKAPPLQRER